jgi:hypothetical protein
MCGDWTESGNMVTENVLKHTAKREIPISFFKIVFACELEFDHTTIVS